MNKVRENLSETFMGSYKGKVAWYEQDKNRKPGWL